MKKDLSAVFHYFGYFSYAPLFEEIYTFFPFKISKKNLRALIDQEVKKKHVHKLLRLPNYIGFGLFYNSSSNYSLATSHSRYTLPQYGTSKKKISHFKFQISNLKIVNTIQTYFFLLKFLPLVRFVGITGASAMWGMRKNDDIDLCIVTKQNALWTTRFFAIVLAKILGVHNKNGVCLNLFFDESDLGISKKKQNLYIAHELLQMKTVIDKESVYRQFLDKNMWIYEFFPNVKSQSAKRKTLRVTHYTFYEHVDYFFKSLQLPIIRRNRTAFYISPTQLWLFKNDFEKKLKQARLVI